MSSRLRASREGINASNTKSGMWKVAYADFITAMMAFFMLLWVLNSAPKENLEGLAKYFTAVAVPTQNTGQNGPAASHIKNEFADLTMSEDEKDYFLSVMNSIKSSLDPEVSSNIVMDLTNEGMRIQIMDSDKRPMFYPGTYTLQPYMANILKLVGGIVNKMPNYISVIGHTGAIKNKSLSSVDLWQLSIDRANKVRQFLSSGIIDPEKIVKIVGQADREPYNHRDIYSSQNIRIGIVLLNKSFLTRHQRSVPDGLFNKR